MTQALRPAPVRVPASYYQRDWFLACRAARSWCSEPVAWQLTGELDPAALSQALEWLMLRHEALRTSLRARGGDVEQLVWPRVQVSLTAVDAAGPAAVDERIIAEAERPRALDVPPLWHGLLLRLGPREHVLALFVHHLVFDGWSHGVLHDELLRCYRAAAGGTPPRLPPLRLQFGDFAQWERSRRDPGREAWWRERLHALPPLAALPPAGGRFVSVPIPAVPRAVTLGLARLAETEGSGPAPAFLAAMLAARQHLTGDDALAGVTRAGRERPGLQRVIGPVLDHVPVRVDLSGGPTFRELLRRVDRAYRDAMAHYLPLGLLRETAAAGQAASRRGRIHDVRFNYLPSAAAAAETVVTPHGGLRVTGWPLDPARLAPRHTEDHPEVLPLSYVLRHQRGGGLAGEVCGHDSAAGALPGLAEAFTSTLIQVAGAGADRPLPGRQVA
jgi:hypothetical protein